MSADILRIMLIGFEVMMGAIDDKYDVDYRVRLIVQYWISCTMILLRAFFKSLGHIFSTLK